MSKVYTTISGDMWDQIAYKQMGSVLYTDKLIKANADYATMFVFPAGVPDGFRPPEIHPETLCFPGKPDSGYLKVYRPNP